jgi:hypothetical protein
MSLLMERIRLRESSDSKIIPEMTEKQESSRLWKAKRINLPQAQLVLKQGNTFNIIVFY